MNITPFNVEAREFPQCPAEGAPVDASACVEPKTRLAEAVGYLILVVGILVAIATIYLFVVMVVGLLVDFFRRKKALAQLKGSAIEVNERQFPEIYRCAQTIAQRLDMKQMPLIYVMEGNVLNAAATKAAGRQVVLLMDDIVHGALWTGDMRTLTFIIAHEMAHHRLGHTGYFRCQVSRMLHWLSRLDEFSCDAVANQIVGDPNVSAKALVLLLTGPQLLAYLNLQQLLEQAREVERDKNSKKSEKTLSHPLLLRRMLRFVA